MFCKHCGIQIPEHANFCPACGGAVKPAATGPILPPDDAETESTAQGAEQTPVSQTPQTRPAPATPQAEDPAAAAARKRRRRILSDVCAIAVLAMMIPLCIHISHLNRYDNAMTMMQTGQYESASAAFLALKGFSDAPEQHQEAERFIAYAAAEALREQGAYLAAMEAFTALGQFENAAARAAECRNAFEYDAADALRASGDYAGAMERFEALGDYADASAQAVQCGYMLDYDAACALMADEDYAGAAALLEPLDENGYGDASQKLLQCYNHIYYAEAAALFDEGRFYSAQLRFLWLGGNGFQDAEERAAACVQPFPEAAELYRNPAFEKGNSQFRVDNRNGSAPLVVRLYTTDNTLVSTICVPEGKRFTVRVPAGSYVIKEAAGSDWFGEKELFGDSGLYATMTNADGSTSIEFKSNYICTLSGNDSAGYAELDPEEVSRDDF